MATTTYSIDYMIQKTPFEINFVFFYSLMYGMKEAIQPHMSYAWFPGNISGGQPGHAEQAGGRVPGWA